MAMLNYFLPLSEIISIFFSVDFSPETNYMNTIYIHIQYMIEQVSEGNE